MNIKEIIAGSGGVLLVIMTLIQLAPLKINPWSAIAGAIGRAVNKEVLKELETVKKKIDEHVVMDDQRVADGHRTRILHFNNELLRGIMHTKEEYVEVLAEIDEYEKYCFDNPKYPNNRAKLAIENIRGNYKDRLQKHDFLT